MQSLFTPIRAEGLTNLRICYDWKTRAVKLEARRDWDPDLDWSRYNKDFVYASILCEDKKILNTTEVWALYQQYDLRPYLESVIELLRKGRHFGIECYYFEKYDIRFMCNVHNWKLGLKNRQHATLNGGIRRHSRDENEYDVIIDGLNLGRGSSFKAIAAGVPYGGCKTTVTMDPLDPANMEIMGFLAYAIDSVRTHTGPDMNFPAEMADVMQEKFSMQYTGGPKDSLGPTGKPTAYGVYKTMKQAARFVWGSESLDGRTIAVTGLGSVGGNMVEYLLRENTKLIISDIVKQRAEQLIAQYPDRGITYVSPDDILYVECDILCPSSIGGIFNDDNIPKLNCKIIWGAANNQLRASSQEEEYRLARLIADRGILFQTEWWANCAGLLTGSLAYMLGKDARFEDLIRRIDERLPASTWENLNEAKERGITPTENAYSRCEDIIYGELYN